jgi:internalin A
MENTRESILEEIRNAKRKRLKELQISGRLREIPAELFELEQLEVLDLDGNRLIAIPEAISRLRNLSTLWLANNSLASLPQSMAKLRQLTRLSLVGNRFERVPDVIYELRSLEDLHLSHNRITELSPKILRLGKLLVLRLNGNPIETPPPEIAAKGVGAVKNYFKQLEVQGQDFLFEAKLLILGEAGAGKTTLANKIRDPDYMLREDEPSTEGIEVTQWYPAMGTERRFRVNIWDFGGQEIYHATHQFFLTKRSLYILVADTRKDDTDFYYWLSVVELLSDNSPLLIVKNEKQDRRREINDRVRSMRGPRALTRRGAPSHSSRLLSPPAPFCARYKIRNRRCAGQGNSASMAGAGYQESAGPPLLQQARPRGAAQALPLISR